MYTQVKLPPLIPPMLWGETGKISSLPFTRGGLGWGNLRNNGGDSITCVFKTLTGGVSHSVAYPCELLAAALRYRRRHQP